MEDGAVINYEVDLSEVTANQKEIISELQLQNAYLAEQNNGLQLVVQFQYGLFAVILGTIAVTIVSKALGWYFNRV